MPGAGLNQLRLHRRYDPARCPYFETEARCRRLDGETSQLVRGLAHEPEPNLDPGWLADVAERLRYEPNDEPLATRALRLHYRGSVAS